MSEVKLEGTGPTLAPVKYKFKELKVYSSDEWMADATKKYRQVYDRWETTYMRCEFSFFNKLFDEEDWDAAIIVKCIFLNGSSPRELCSLPQTRKVLKDENIVYIREAWGNATPGVYWQKGNYAWEAYIDNKKVGEGKFFVEDIGQPKEGENLFFDVEHIKMFEGDGKAGSLPEKRYLSKFSHKETRFIWGEFAFKNKTNADYYAEVIFNFADDSGQLKGKAVQLIYVPVNTAGQVFKMFPAWGSETPGTWNNNTYTMEAVFMDNLIATVVFQGAEAFEEGGLNVVTDSGQLLKASVQKNASGNSSLDNILFEALGELNALTGLDNIKTEVNEMVKLVRFYQESGKDVLNRFSLHTVFTGNPGTGKTTVARILAKIYKGLGILEKGHLIEVDRQGLVAGFVGQTAIKTGDKVTEAIGGILFIDEAYSLANEAGSQNDFGGESIQVILKRMEDMRGKFGVIVAGYTENMQDFINSNPGLRSRFDQYFLFDDYSDAHMCTISDSLFAKDGMKVQDDAREHLKNYFNYLHLGRDKYFGNARTVRQVVGEVIKNQNLRLAAIKKEERTAEMLETIILDDVKEFQIKELNQRNSSLGFKIGKK